MSDQIIDTALRCEREAAAMAFEEPNIAKLLRDAADMLRQAAAELLAVVECAR